MAKKPIRIWVDGCFDMMHYGHANALRQVKLSPLVSCKAREMGDELVVGVHSDLEILKHKGPTVMNETERYAAVRACKWVDQVVEDAPYFTSVEFLQKYDCDYCVHGDDITTLADGTDCYQAVKDAGLYKECKRTNGVSTTELVGRMLTMSKEHLRKSFSTSGSEHILKFAQTKGHHQSVSVYSSVGDMNRLTIGKETSNIDKIVYVDVGHVEFLKKAKEYGSYLIVGVHSDITVNNIKGSNYPIMAAHERVLGVLACRYVDHVVIDAPYSVNQDLVDKLPKLSFVIHGSTPYDQDLNEKDPYHLVRELKLYVEIESPLDMTSETIVGRILEHRKLYEDRNKRKLKKSLLESQMAADPKQH